ncbi:MAG: hypothetical protein JXA97_11620 [Anaerolineales bacterium]|nr:hypothetical protein [Anaerolineales bacterium]
MKRKSILFLLLVALMLVSCSGTTPEGIELTAAPAQASGDEGIVNEGELDEVYDQSQVEASVRELSDEARLMLGIMLLDGTEHAVEEAQAGDLLFLWQAYQALLQSDTTAVAELEALIQQIRRTMTEEQISAIEGMDFTDPAHLAQIADLGIGMGGMQNPDALPEGVEPGQRNQGGQGGQGGRLDGTMGTPPEGMEIDPEAMEVFADRVRASGVGRGGAQQGLYLAPLIRYLEQVSGGVEG